MSAWRPKVAMVFAAGLGTRMGALTRQRPKPLIEVAGKPLIDHALDLLAAAGIARAVVNTHYLPELIEAHLSTRTRPRIDTSREPARLETGGGIRAARDLLGPGPILTLNADMAWQGGDPVATLCTDGPPAPGAARLLLIPRDRATAHAGPGDFERDGDGALIRRGEKPEAPYVYAGMQLIDPAPVYEWSEQVFSLNTIWDRMLDRGALTGVVHEGGWCDVGRPESLPLAEAMLTP